MEKAEATNPENCVVPSTNVPTPITAAAVKTAAFARSCFVLFAIFVISKIQCHIIYELYIIAVCYHRLRLFQKPVENGWLPTLMKV